jgi:hypothetical protein
MTYTYNVSIVGTSLTDRQITPPPPTARCMMHC